MSIVPQSHCRVSEYSFTSLSAQSWQYRDIRKPEAGTMPYSYSEWLQGFFIVHSTIGSTVHSMPLKKFGALCMHNYDDKIFVLTGIRTWYLQVTSPSRYEWAGRNHTADVTQWIRLIERQSCIHITKMDGLSRHNTICSYCQKWYIKKGDRESMSFLRENEWQDISHIIIPKKWACKWIKNIHFVNKFNCKQYVIFAVQCFSVIITYINTTGRLTLSALVFC